MNDSITERKGGIMEFLIPIAVLAVWIALQLWVLPRMGVRT
jgi:hypothetical protein